MNSDTFIFYLVAIFPGVASLWAVHDRAALISLVMLSAICIACAMNMAYGLGRREGINAVHNQRQREEAERVKEYLRAQEAHRKMDAGP